MFSKYHKESLNKYAFLITGGAGFIGSNLVQYLIQFGAGKIRILDNLSTGRLDNINQFFTNPNVEFLNGDICSIEDCRKAVKGIDFILHQAALGSVPRSIKDPLLTNENNVSGFLNIITAAKDAKVKRFVYASSSSVYGNSRTFPKTEAELGEPLSPYAVSKLVNELYADTFSKVYDFHSVGLRYFNVFGPRQNPKGDYAAVIPLFISRMLNEEQPYINGDGFISRDFTFVENVIQANIKALFSEKIKKHEVMNIACNEEVTLLELVKAINHHLKSDISPVIREKREGDITHSLANIGKARQLISYIPNVNFAEGIQKTIEYYRFNNGGQD